jgi:TolA-binding protein
MKREIFVSVAIILSLLLLSSLLAAQEGRGKGRIVGVILAEDGTPIEGVEVTLESTNFNFKLSTISDAKGEWGFFGFGRDVFTFTFKKEGYQTSVSRIMLSGVSRNEDQKITLKKAPEIPKGAIVISEALNADFKKGNALFKEKKYADALSYYEGIVKEKPELYKIRYNLANCLKELKNYPRALEEYEKFLDGLKKEKPDLTGNKLASEVYVNMGTIYLEQQKYDEAAKNYITSMEIAPPTDAAVAYNVAEICFSAEKIEDAIKYYKLAIQLRPEFAGYYKKLGYAYLNQGDLDTAKSNFRKFLEMAPTDPDAAAIKELVTSL